jgi:hypothetical protein
MRPNDMILATQINANLNSFKKIERLPGINNLANKDCLVKQIIDSIRRIEYISVIRDKNNSPSCTDATSNAFDPLKAAAFHIQNGNIDEAFWLVFLSIHFGKNKKTNWRLVQDIYGGLGYATFWSWNRTRKDPNAFRQWLNANESIIRRNGSFGNHRKYQSLNALKSNGTGAAIASYIKWVETQKNHKELINNALNNAGNDPRILFHYLYNSINTVYSFGRMAKFDYLTMVGKLKLAPIEPGSPYLHGASGPVFGARLLFGGRVNAPININDLEDRINKLESHLGLYFGMQVIEDALCNWQKSPARYSHFIG